MERATQEKQSTSNPKEYSVNLCPTIVTYNSVLNACASSCPNVVAEELAKRGATKSVKSETTTREETKNGSLGSLPGLCELVCHLYQRILNHPTIQADHFTFGTTLKAVQAVFWGDPEEQVRFGRQVFADACERGQVTPGVLLQFRHAVPDHVYREVVVLQGDPKELDEKGPSGRRNVVGNSFGSMSEQLPFKWRRNVKEDPRRLRQRK